MTLRSKITKPKSDSENELSQLRSDCSTRFSNSLFSIARAPIARGIFDPNNLGDQRVNHFLIKAINSDDICFGNLESKELQDFCLFAINDAKSIGLEVFERYVYLTYDAREVPARKTMRTPGWHFDGMQGDEVECKTNACYQYTWFDKIQTEFAVQPFYAAHLDASVHNYFTSLTEQVVDAFIRKANLNTIYLTNAYNVHRGSVSDETSERRFIRLYFSHQRNTSVMMTVNHFINYDYEIHTTTGAIPDLLTTAPGNR